MDTPYEKLLVSLARADVRFIVVGGLAVALNGFVRTTEDVDILVDSASDNIGALLSTLGAFGAGHARELDATDFAETEGAIRVVEDFPLDIFTIMRGQRYADLCRSVRTIQIGDCTISYLAAPALIALKERSRREKDQIDVAALKAL